MAQETSIEWLGHQIATMLMKDLSIEHTARLSEMLEIAGQKHKREIESAYTDGAIGMLYKTYKGFHEYYNETYGNI